MKKILTTILLFAMVSLCFSEEPAKRPLKPFTKVVAETGARIDEKLPGIYDMEIEVKYELSEDKKTCKAKLNVNIMIDSDEVKKVSKADIERILLSSLEESVKGYACWAFFFCEVKGTTIKYDLYPVKKVIKKKQEKKKDKDEKVA